LKTGIIAFAALYLQDEFLFVAGSGIDAPLFGYLSYFLNSHRPVSPFDG